MHKVFTTLKSSSMNCLTVSRFLNSHSLSFFRSCTLLDSTRINTDSRKTSMTNFCHSFGRSGDMNPVRFSCCFKELVRFVWLFLGKYECFYGIRWILAREQFGKIAKSSESLQVLERTDFTAISTISSYLEFAIFSTNDLNFSNPGSMRVAHLNSKFIGFLFSLNYPKCTNDNNRFFSNYRQRLLQSRLYFLC